MPRSGSFRGERDAIRKWYAQHPKTYCPVIGQMVCKQGGCERADLRADPRCNVELKDAQAKQRASAPDDGRGWLFDLRESPDRRYYILNFGYNRGLLDDFKAIVPASGRRFDPETREWWVLKAHGASLVSLFANFGAFLAALARQQSG